MLIDINSVFMAKSSQPVIIESPKQSHLIQSTSEGLIEHLFLSCQYPHHHGPLSVGILCQFSAACESLRCGEG